MSMLTIKQLYDAYPGADLIPISVGGGTTLADIEAADAESGGIGDTLFLFLCRELCDKDDDCGMNELAGRCCSAEQQLHAVAERIRELQVAAEG